MTDSQRDAMYQALDALEISLPAKCADQPDRLYLQERDKHRTAITALQQALAEPVVEPVAWLYTLEYGATVVNMTVSLHQLNYPFGVCGADYARSNDDGFSYVRQTTLYTSPPPPAKVPLLTDGNILWLWNEAYKDTTDKMPFQVFARSIEQLVRQKVGINEKI